MSGDDGLLDGLLRTPAMRAVFSDRARLQGMLDFEAALARAEASAGVIPAGAAASIAACCHAERLDAAAISRDAAAAGNLAIPLVRQLTRIVAAEDESAATFVHWGATSQDAQDTGLVLQMRAALDVLEARLGASCDAAAALAARHQDTLLPGRTWLQHALPITFGLKAAGWLDALERHRVRFADLRKRVLVLQFGGAAGTLASLGERGLEVAEALAAELKLTLPALPWHTQRDRIGETATTLALLVGTLGKIARDVSLLMQTELGEAFEPGAPGRGGSSSMPHKRNPVSSAVVLAAAVQAPGLAATVLAAMVQEHERGLGGWHAEWTTLPELFQLSAGALEHSVTLLEGLELDPVRMAANLEQTQGLLLAEAVKLALAPSLGTAAHGLVERACRDAIAKKRHLRDVLAAEPQVSAVLDAAALDRLFDARGYLGVTRTLIERVLADRPRTAR